MGELSVEVWDLGGQRNEKQLQKLSLHPEDVIASSRFLGRIEVSLSETMITRRGEPLSSLADASERAAATALQS